MTIEEGIRIKKATGNTDHYPTRYVVTHIDKEGVRTLAFAAQGRNTYATPEEAQAMVDAIKANNSVDTLARFTSLEVRPCKCYPGHFDPCERYFDFDLESWLEDRALMDANGNKCSAGGIGMKAPCIFILDENGEAYDLVRFCSNECREVFTFPPQWINPTGNYGEDGDYITGTVCDHCGKPLLAKECAS